MSLSLLVQLAVNLILTVLMEFVKNPASKAALETDLVGVANSIYTVYGLTPPAQNAAVKTEIPRIPVRNLP
jgi:hypothetical protein